MTELQDASWRGPSRAGRKRWAPWSGLAAVVVALFATATIASASGTSWQSKVDTSVLNAASGGNTGFFVYLKPKANLSGAELHVSKEAKSRHIYEQLTATASSTQGPVVAALNNAGAQHRSFWITNAIVATGSLDAIQAVASLPEVEHVYSIGTGRLEPPIEADVPGGTTGFSATTTVFESTDLVKADEAWSLGYRGQGAVVAGADTGVRWTHEAIKSKYRGWNGTTANHDYNWHDSIHNPNAVCPPDSPEPCDDDKLIGGGHGTHTVGTMVGAGPNNPGQKNEFGMAPDAKWIACRNMNNGLGIIPMYFECMQWFLAPTRVNGAAPDPSKAPDVVNNSWGCVEVCPPPALQDALRASRAAGIFYAVSAGNDGGRVVAGQPVVVCSSIYHPLARYPEAFTVGSTTWTTDTISSFSSRGPVVLGDPPSTLLLRKPNITAPGSSIRSAIAYPTINGPGSDSAYGSLSGTSMAGPHVAGLVALLISADPMLKGNVDRLEDIIEQTAVRKTTTEGCGLDSTTQVPNNTYGWGRIDALAAVLLAASPKATISSAIAELNAAIAETPGGSDKLEDARDKLQKALDELNKTPPQRQAAMGAIEGAMGDLEAAANEGHLDAADRVRILDRVTGAARQLAVDAIKEANARGGDAGKIAEANRFLNEGDGLRAATAFKDAVAKYKDALSKAEGA